MSFNIVIIPSGYDRVAQQEVSWVSKQIPLDMNFQCFPYFSYKAINFLQKLENTDLYNTAKHK